MPVEREVEWERNLSSLRGEETASSTSQESQLPVIMKRATRTSETA